MRYRFEGFEFDPEIGLSRAGESIPLEPLAIELLHYLIENQGRVVGRDELNERLWDGRAVSDAALSTQIRSVRRALGDDRLRQGFIKTYPRRGFGFVAALETSDEDKAIADHLPTQQRDHGISIMMVAAGIVVLVLGGLVIWTSREVSTSVAQPARGLSIAVLPFENLSGDKSKDYLADAFTEDLITDLSRIRDAFVISRSTTFTYRGKETSPAEVAAELGVRYVLEGSVRIDDDKVRINAQLIDGETNSHLWSDRYDCSLQDLFDLKDNVTGRIASVLRAELRIEDDKRQDPEATKNAWDYALRGNVILYNHQSIADYQDAYAMLTEAVTLDPTISSAWAGLSFVHLIASLTDVPGVSQPNSAELSLETALKAVQADPENAEPYWLVGAGYARNGQSEKGMPACESAIDLNPNMDCGYVCAGLVFMAKGQPEKAVPNFQFALKLNPRFRPFTKEKYLGLAYIQHGEDDLAIDALNHALAGAPKDTFANLALTAALALNKQIPKAEEALQRYVDSTGKQPPSLTELRNSIGWMGPNVERMLDGLRDVGVSED